MHCSSRDCSDFYIMSLYMQRMQKMRHLHRSKHVKKHMWIANSSRNWKESHLPIWSKLERSIPSLKTLGLVGLHSAFACIYSKFSKLRLCIFFLKNLGYFRIYEPIAGIFFEFYSGFWASYFGHFYLFFQNLTKIY